MTTDLAHALTADEVAAVVVDNGVAAVGARSGGLWTVDGSRARLRRPR